MIMILQVFSVYDVKADVYMPPFFMSAVGQAVRAFKDLANDRNTTVGRHPGDFKLVKIGAWDDSTAVFEPMSPVMLGFAEDFVDKNVIALRKDA